jgi:hypothetical protein
MARAKTSEQLRARSKLSMIEDLSRGAGELREFLAQVEDLGREGFPYLDAGRARTELQFRECIRRTFGEKSPEFQEHRHHKLLMGSAEETRQSIALIKSLIATLEQKKLELQGGPPPQQVSAPPPIPPTPKPPQMTIVPASISTVQMTVTQTGPIPPPPVAIAVPLTTHLDMAAPIAVPNLPPPSAPPSDSREPEPLRPSTIPPKPPLVSPTPTAAAMSPPPLKPVVRVDPEPQQQLSSAAAPQPAQADVPHAAMSPGKEPTPIMDPIPSVAPQQQMPEGSPFPPHVVPRPSGPVGLSTHQEPAPQSFQTGSDPIELVRVLCRRFHSVARQLRLRGEYRATLSVEDELDVQDLLHALLRIQFDDIGTEEWTPSYAEGASRTTFLLNDNRFAVLVKKTRNGLTAKDLTEQLRIDTERYRTKSRCTSLLCFIYDPEGRIGNPRALETSLTTVSDSLTIDVLVAPK